MLEILYKDIKYYFYEAREWNENKMYIYVCYLKKRKLHKSYIALTLINLFLNNCT